MIKELIGLLLIYSALNFLYWVVFGFDMTIKDRIIGAICIEIFLILLCVSSFLLLGGA